ncbi:short-chain-enoyl-CoA hydratase [Abyssisolibacter fermentans]|uniref:short-chain-enoyl-CoA hydratase n=1 Tax=Abyssisolibacter fermentans TaxID=1766203 RepID=UPI0008331AA7|nr:short-chain-enoyl-CoA hydratase [Abyssisolibacter fermentans]
MKLKNLLLETKDEIGILSFNRPKTLNALNSEILRELDLAVDEIISNDEIKVLILTGEGKAFVAGADITQMKGLNAQQGRNFGKLGADVFRKIELMEKPVIAAVNGFALGGGCELAMCCDIRIAGEKAKFGQPEVGLGIIPGFNGTLRLPRIVGIAKAKELIFTGGMIDSAEAEKIGLVNKIVKQDQLMQEAIKMAKSIASNAQIAVKHSKVAINRGFETDLETAMEIEKDLFGLCFATEDQVEGMTAFVEKRKPKFTNK